MALRYKVFIEELTSLVESGEVPLSRIDDAVERILRVKFAAGLFEFPFSDRSLLDTVGCKVINSSAHSEFLFPLFRPSFHLKIYNISISNQES